jgi:hypothetical protein
MSEEYIVRSAAPTLAGMKTGSLFPCRFNSREQMIGEIREANKRLGKKGMRLLPLRFQDGMVLLYLYRPLALEHDLQDVEAQRLLREAGYQDSRLGRCLPKLMYRLQNSDGFPHEIGLFLSYPPEDVRGFIENKGHNCKCTGYWKVYGDAERARRRFADFRSCTDRYCRQYAKGVPLEQLMVAGS